MARADAVRGHHQVRVQVARAGGDAGPPIGVPSVHAGGGDAGAQHARREAVRQQVDHVRAQRDELRIAEPGGQPAQVGPDQPAAAGAAQPAVALDGGEAPYLVAEADAVERVQGVRAEAQARPDRFERLGAFEDGHVPAPAPQRHRRGEPADPRAHHYRVPAHDHRLPCPTTSVVPILHL
jgi:hypothetical protein